MKDAQEIIEKELRRGVKKELREFTAKRKEISGLSMGEEEIWECRKERSESDSESEGNDAVRQLTELALGADRWDCE